MLELIEHIDTQLFLFLNGKHNEFFDVIMWWVSYKFTWVPLYAVLVFILWKKFGVKTLYVLLMILLLVMISDQVSVKLFKNVFERYRPCYNLLIKDQIHLVDGCGGMYGFVSTHASNSFALATFLSLVLRNKPLVLVLFSWAVLNCYSRIYLGMHYPLDVIAGGLLGAIIGVSIYGLFRFADKNKS